MYICEHAQLNFNDKKVVPMLKPGVDPTTVSYNACVVKIYKLPSAFRKQKEFLLLCKNAIAYFKFRSRSSSTCYYLWWTLCFVPMYINTYICIGQSGFFYLR
jgi:hypothetical protein